MAYINALKEVSQLVSDNWTLTPVVYVNAPQPKMHKSGAYAGFYIRVYGGSTSVESELSTEKRKVDQGLVYVDIHAPDGHAYLKSDVLAREVAILLDAKYYNGVQLGTVSIQPDAGYWQDGTQVTRITVDYVCDYSY